MNDETLQQHLLLGREHYGRHDYARAEGHLRAVLSEHGRFADVCNMLAVIAHERGAFSEARDLLERALEINPNYLEAALNLAIVYNHLGEWEKARALQQYTVGRTGIGAVGVDEYSRGKLANMHANVARAYEDIGVFDRAADEYRAALAHAPNFADLRARLANVLRNAGDRDGARKECELALANTPGFQRARVLLGLLLLEGGQGEEAVALWKEVLASDPDNKHAALYLRAVATRK